MLVAWLIGLLWLAGVSQAQPQTGAVGAPSLTGSDLASFLDAFVPAQLARERGAGAVVAVVKDGAVLLCRGYGYSDVENRIPMTSETLVRPASISKLFTAIAALQLVRQGKLDLDRDVNEYLDLRIPTLPGATPVTLRLLLTHRAGFEDHLKELFQAGGSPAPARVWVGRNLPRRLFVNGDVPAYSNYGYALAGYLIERASGERFEDYTAKHILEPLGMTRSTFEEPPAEPLAISVARGYARPGEGPLRYFEVMQPSVGGLSATAADMGRFMIALLTKNTLLEPESLPLAFEEDYAAGNRFIGKHGLTNAVVSHLALLSEAGFGLFVSYNSEIPMNGQTELLEAVARRYFQRPQRPLVQIASAAVDARAVAGAWQPSQREDSNFLRLRALGEQLVIEPLPDDRIRLAGTRLILTETAPLVFENRNDARMSFHPTPDGGMSMTFTAVPIAMEWQKVPVWLDRRLVTPAVSAGVAVMLSTLLLWPVAAATRRRRHRPFSKGEQDQRDFRRVRFILAVDLISLASMGLMAGIATQDLTRLNASLDPWLTLNYVLASLGVLATPIVVWIAWRFWRDGVGTQWGRIHHTALAASAVVFAWFVITWRIAGTTLNY
jgi:CubicO group peptidase (beta-lactamase class C family)